MLAGQARQTVAPALLPVFVIEPASQSVHEATFDAVEYLPASHAVHVVAPALVPVSVIEPAAHVMQSVSAVEPVAPTYSPTGHPMQSAAAAEPDTATYLPAPQSVHDATFDAVEYVPAAH